MGRCAALLAVTVVGLAACSDGPDASAPATTAGVMTATTGAPPIARATVEGITFEYATELFVRASGTAAEGSVLVELTPTDDGAAPAQMRVTTLRSGAGTDLDVPRDVSAAAQDVAEAALLDGSDPVPFVNGAGSADVIDGVWTFVGVTDGGSHLLEVDVPLHERREIEVARAAQTLVGTVFVDVSADALVVEGCDVGVEIVDEAAVPGGAVVGPRQQVTALWRVRNAGSCPWTPGDSWAFSGGDPLTLVEIPSVGGVEPGDEMDVSVTLLSPAEPGKYSAEWRFLPAGSRDAVGPTVEVELQVVED